MPQQGVIGTNIELPGVSLRSAPGYDLAGPSVRMGNPNRSAVTRTQPWVKPIGATHGQPTDNDRHNQRIPIHPPLRGSYPLVDIYRGFHPRLYSRHTYGVQDTTPYIFIKEKRPEGATDHSPRQRLG